MGMELAYVLVASVDFQVVDCGMELAFVLVASVDFQVVDWGMELTFVEVQIQDDLASVNEANAFLKTGKIISEAIQIMITFFGIGFFKY